MRGEVVALVGESGCGKTTLARAVLGLQPLTDGSISFDGLAVADIARRGLQALPTQGAARLPGSDRQHQSSASRSTRSSPRACASIARQADEEARVAEALSDCGLRPPEQFFHRFPHELSGGQRQRVVIAGAMVLEPSLLVADEPVSSLDASVRGEILQLLLGLSRERGMTILVVTHDLGLAWNIADRVAVMYLGRIVEVGTTEQILAAPQHPYTQGAAVGGARARQAGTTDPHRRGAGPDAHPCRVPVPSALPAVPKRRSRAARASSTPARPSIRC